MRGALLNRIAAAGLLGAMLALAGCGSAPVVSKGPAPLPKAAPTRVQEPGVPVLPPANSGRGAYYQDDGPGDNPPPNLAQVPDAEVRNDPLLPRSNRPYVVFGKTYTPIPNDQPFTQRGLGTWYGKKFHGQRTSSGEIYDMYKMTAAHPTLPIPSYARVTNLANGKSVVVRINDRGPFHSTRVIDVSYTAALKLGLLANGSSQLEVTRIMPAEIEQILAARKRGESPEIAAVEKPKGGLASSNGSAPAEPPKAPTASAAPPEIESMMLGAAAGATPAAEAGYYLQLGAFSRADNAEAMRVRLVEAGSADVFEVVKNGAVFRLYGGPYASRQDAAQAALRLPASLKLKPIIIQR
ncbi:septal ring lytic transglycosylase RlpA family protein [Massilia endophytica]|uniref:septal ring lytic transglycosylase RlpA family protein n=1 Tax=Massilia endophytica TaxID=2899220 RepID=UPI001E6072A9|nr:septal ring lytic transglycosylase RlpA family protein [Massilia endophytica]UGQ47016.1 septal ring lytic transglycosylase RlpA family protein [Massilia endophytica]